MCAAKLQIDKEQASERRHMKALDAKHMVHTKLQEDPSFRALYLAVALTFADQLRQDLADLQASKKVTWQFLFVFCRG